MIDKYTCSFYKRRACFVLNYEADRKVIQYIGEIFFYMMGYIQHCLRCFVSHFLLFFLNIHDITLYSLHEFFIIIHLHLESTTLYLTKSSNGNIKVSGYRKCCLVINHLVNFHRFKFCYYKWYLGRPKNNILLLNMNEILPSHVKLPKKKQLST